MNAAASETEFPDRSRMPLSLRLCDILAWRARHSGNEPALIFARAPRADSVLTWAEWDRRADELAAVLRTRGTGRADRIVLMLQDAPDCLAMLIAIWRVGAVAVPLDERWTPDMIERVVAHAAPACVVDGAFYDGLPRSGADLSRHADEGGDGDCDDLAMIAYTSGTTSNPKGVMLRHRHFRSAYRLARDCLFDSPPARIGNPLRMASLGVLGISYLFGIECGSAVVVMPELRLDTVSDFWREVEHHRVGFMYLVLTLVELVARLAEPVPDPRRVLVISGGAPISEKTHATFQDRFGHVLRNVYGLTEATCGIFWGAVDPAGRSAWHLGPVPRGLRVRLRDADGDSSDAVTEGEIEVTGDILSDGYWKNPAATNEVFVDGWLRTGDIACRSPEGNYRITGRKKNVVIRGGFNIHLEEVEETLLGHADVIAACVVGIKHTDREEGLAAMVQVRPGSTTSAETLAAWCRTKLGAHKTPSAIVLVTRELPRNSSGKLLRNEVARQIVDEAKQRRVEALG